MKTNARVRSLLGMLGVTTGMLGCGARAGLDVSGDEGSVAAEPGAKVTLPVRQILSGTVWNPGVEQFTCSGDVAARCEQDEDCCYKRCVRYINGLGDVVAQCYGSGPPNAPCGHTPCASGLCSTQCLPDDRDCRGVCLPSLPGSSCRFDADCMVGRCLPGGTIVSGSGYCEQCTTDADCPQSYCNQEERYDQGWCEDWRATISKLYSHGTPF